MQHYIQQLPSYLQVALSSSVSIRHDADAKQIIIACTSRGYLNLLEKHIVALQAPATLWGLQVRLEEQPAV